MLSKVVRLSALFAMLVILTGCAAMAPNQKLSEYKYDPIKRSANTLHGAISHGNYKRARQLISNGANVNSQDELGKTPLYVVAENGDSHAVELLLNLGADPMIAIPANPDNKLDGPNLPLSIAVFKGNEQIVESLLDAGADPNAKDEAGMRALHYGALYSGKDIAQMLIDYGANVNARTEYAVTPLHYAALGELNYRSAYRPRVIKTLIEAGANVNAYTEYDRNFSTLGALKRVHEGTCWEAQCETCQYIDVCWAQVVMGQNGGYTPLMIAVRQPDFLWRRYSDKAVIANALLRSGAEPTARSKYKSQTAGDIVHDLGHYSERDIAKMSGIFPGGVPEDDSSFIKSVASATVTAVAAKNAGMDTDRAAQLGVDTAKNVYEDGVTKGVSKSLTKTNQQLRRENRRMAAQLQAQRQSQAKRNWKKPDSQRPAEDDGASSYEQGVQRSQKITNCMRSTGLSMNECAKKESNSNKQHMLSVTHRFEYTECIEKGGTPTSCEHHVMNKYSASGAQSAKNQRSGSTQKTSSENPASEPETKQREKEYVDVNEALALCWQNKSDWWRCSGRIQESMTADKTEEEAISYVGCDNPRRRVEGVSIIRDSWSKSRSAVLYYCDQPLAEHDDDIREEFDFTIPPAAPAIPYRCEKLSTGGYYDNRCKKGKS